MCDRELDLLGDISGFDLLYAGGASLLWLEGLSQRLGEHGTLTALEADPERIETARELLRDADLAAPVHLVAGDVFATPLAPDSFDLVYSAGLFHELDVRERPARAALDSLISVIKPGGHISASDFISSVPAVQLEDEELHRWSAREKSGAELYGIGPLSRLIALHKAALRRVCWRVLTPYKVRHLERLVLAEPEPDGLMPQLRRRRDALLERVRTSGYTRPATVYVEGVAGVRGDVAW